MSDISNNSDIPDDPASDLISNTQSGRRDAEDVQSTPASSGGGIDSGITGDGGPGGGLTGPGTGGLPDNAAEGTGGANSGSN